MAKLNYYDVDAVKAFVLDMLVENQELRSEVKSAREGRDFWLKKHDEDAEALDAIKAKVSKARAVLTGLKDTMNTATVTEDAILSVITNALTGMEGGETK